MSLSYRPFELSVRLIQGSVAYLYSYVTMRYFGWAWWLMKPRDPAWSKYDNNHFNEAVTELEKSVLHETKFLYLLEEMQNLPSYRVFSNYHSVIMEQPAINKFNRERIVAALSSPYLPITNKQRFWIAWWIFKHWMFWIACTMLAGDVLVTLNRLAS